MRRYETVLILDPDLSEIQLKEEVSKYEGMIASFGAVNLSTDRWGKKALGTNIHKCTHGNYVCLTYDTENNALTEQLGSQLRLIDSVLKFQSHRLTDKKRKFKGNLRRASSSDGFDSDSDDFGDSDSD